LLILVPLSCGPKPGTGTYGSGDKRISGFIHVTEISGRLGTKVMSRPGSLALDHRGNVVICDTGNHRLIKVKPDGTFLTEIGGFGFSREEFNHPAALATSDGVNFHLLDSENGRIIQLDYDLNWIAEEYLADALLDPPVGLGTGIAISSFGDLFFSDPDNRRVVKFDAQFSVASELTEPGAFIDPGAMTVDQADNLYVVDRQRDCILLFDSYDNHIGTVGPCNVHEPSDICADRGNLLYTADGKANVVRVLRADGKEIYSFGMTGTGQYQFRQAHSICVNREGWLFVSDYGGDRVVVYRPSGP
jgi:sugar lactone lactonase YvrE